MSNLTYDMMKCLATAGALDVTDQYGMVDSREIARVLDVKHGDVIYLLTHQAQMGRLSQQAILSGMSGSWRSKVVGQKFSINASGRKWLEQQDAKK